MYILSFQALLLFKPERWTPLHGTDGVLGQTETQGGIVGTAPHLEGRAIDKLALEHPSLADKALH